MNTSKKRIARLLLRPEWRLHLAHLGSIYYQSSHADHLFILIDDRSPHLGETAPGIVESFVEDLNWLELPNISIVRISDYYEILFHCAHWFVDRGETHIEKVIVQSSRPQTQPPYIKKYYLRESEMPKVKVYFNRYNTKYTRTGDGDGSDAPSLNKLAGRSKLRIRTNASEEAGSTVLMSYYLDGRVCDLSLSFCLPIIDCFLNVTTIFEQINGANPHAIIGEETHNFNRKIFSLLNKKYPTYVSYPGFKLLNYRYHSDELLRLVRANVLRGFDDPRLLTVKNIRERGFPKGILREFVRIGIRRGTVDPQQLPDVSKNYFPQKALPKHKGIIEPIKVILSNFPSKVTRYYSSHFCRDIVALRKLFWIDGFEVRKLASFQQLRTPPPIAKDHNNNNNDHEPHRLGAWNAGPPASNPPTGLLAATPLVRRRPAPFMLKGTNTYVQLEERVPGGHKSMHWSGFIFSRKDGQPFPNSLPWLSCDPVESPFKVRFHFYPEFYTGHVPPKPVKILDGLLDSQPKSSGVIVVQGYGFFYYDGDSNMHLMYACPKSKAILTMY